MTTRTTQRTVPLTTIVWTVIVLALAVILVAQQTSRPRANTIPVPTLDAPVDRIVFAEGSSQLELRLRDDGWVVGEAGYPAAGTIGELLEEIEALGAADVVSARGSFAEYGVDEGEGRFIRLFSGSIEPLAIQLGDGAAAGDGVYARLNGSREVVLLPQRIDSVFTLETDELRETVMARIGEDEVVDVVISMDDADQVRVVRAEEADGDAGFSWEVASGGGDSDGAVAPSGETDPAHFRSLFQELDSLQAQSFLDAAPSAGAFAEITVTETSGEVEVIRLFPPDADGNYPVTTSSSRYAFLIPQWRARRLLLGMDPAR